MVYKMKSEKEIQEEIDIKLLHILSINKSFNLKDLDIMDHSIVALELYDIVRKWGLHMLPLRVLHELDIRLSRIASNLEYVNYED
jgi:hypothetical protein